jgi:hypothetical protein
VKFRLSVLSLAAAIPATLGLLTAGAGTAAAAPYDFQCPSSRNPTSIAASTVTSPRSVQISTGGQTFKVELRYSSSTRYAWGRVTMVSPSSTTAKAYHVWTDRTGSAAGGQMCQVNRPGGYLRSGGQDWTSAIGDAGSTMRACFKLRDYAAIACTGWY